MWMWKLTGRIRREAARSNPSAANFSAQSKLNDFFGFFSLAVADKNGHDLFFSFEGIRTNLGSSDLANVLGDKMTPRYHMICLVIQNDRTCQRVIKTVNV